MLYLNAAIIFPAAFTLIWELSPAAFMSPPATTDDLGELATMLYFNLTTLTTTGYGDNVPVDPFARSLANLEFGFGAILSRHYGRPPRDDGTRRPAPQPTVNE